ncbi:MULTISPECIES: DUF5518 domain-containing protein [Haloarcula]|uniref:DUF5518 domain-containing protein n=1 Tax=Haloarcula pellucida TaxID=1427151 RepID=A0A830GIM5_9EURY|nr:MULTISPECIES: DUF5518 domain-containing protein [Halomicroarcula]MBX0347812.1 DUF5518 domain-containing protein [Halomicroarcula pellucida]MDS0276254.1 DUF5518 domain-containing protein [Halomicroarcula sp. S1AR25-4]GGN90410.1 hypothetical protein GCM10009030_12360 [Halomicroarcula pellucida]
MAEQDTLLNAVIGAVATAILSGFPFAPVFGGALAGYLEGGDRDDGLRVGAISGAIGLVFTLVVFAFVGLVFLGFLLGGMPMHLGAVGVVFLVGAAVFAAVYVVGLSALGGWLGNYVKYDTDLGN